MHASLRRLRGRAAEKTCCGQRARNTEHILGRSYCDRWRRERDISCGVLPSLTNAALLAVSGGLFARWASPCLACSKMFFLRTRAKRPSTTSVQDSKPFTVGLLGALDGSDTSRTQVVLADYVDWTRSTPTPKNPRDKSGSV